VASRGDECAKNKQTETRQLSAVYIYRKYESLLVAKKLQAQ